MQATEAEAQATARSLGKAEVSTIQRWATTPAGMARITGQRGPLHARGRQGIWRAVGGWVGCQAPDDCSGGHMDSQIGFRAAKKGD